MAGDARDPVSGILDGLIDTGEDCKFLLRCSGVFRFTISVQTSFIAYPYRSAVFSGNVCANFIEMSAGMNGSVFANKEVVSTFLEASCLVIVHALLKGVVYCLLCGRTVDYDKIY